MHRSIAISFRSQLVRGYSHPGGGSSSNAGSEESLSRNERGYIEWSSEARQQPGSKISLFSRTAGRGESSSTRYPRLRSLRILLPRARFESHSVIAGTEEAYR